jgi:hypothetical protein
VIQPVLQPDHLAQLRTSSHAQTKIRRAVSVARFDGCTIALFAALTLLFGLTDLPSILLAAAMATIAFIELRAAARLQALDLSAPNTLMWNQIAFGSLLFTYGAVQLARSLAGPSPYAAALASEPQLQELLGPVEEIVKLILYAVYGGLMLVAILGQGSMAWYYASRKPILQRYLAATPKWVLDIQRAVAGG